MTDTGVKIDIPEQLIQAARNRKISLFVGAGFSRNISPTIPDASRLVEFAAQHAKIDKRLLNLHAKGDYMLVAEYLGITGVLRNALATLENQIQDKSYDVSKSRLHVQLTEIDFDNIFTTNWDNWIEKAFEYCKINFDVVRIPAELVNNKVRDNRSDYGRDRATRIIKYHGDFQYPDSIVFTMSSYFSRILEHSPFNSILETDFFSNSFLFLGYSFSDPNLRLIWYRLLRQRSALSQDTIRQIPKSFIVSNDVNPIMTAWLSELGIGVIQVNPIPSKLASSLEFLLDKIIGAQHG